jgi:hypothetical protein
VSFKRAEAIVTYEQGAVTIEQTQEVVARSGFTATLKSPSAK